jgi:hypothetical protein|tara:strand:- start:392 stop:1159 length:768 start_codon:yes stop_codon:yes gene_type:complete
VVNAQVDESPAIGVVTAVELPEAAPDRVLPVAALEQPSSVAAAANLPTDAIAFWLGEAGWAFEQDKLTTPKGESSYYYLARVLTKEPNNALAIAALEKIVVRYYELLQASLAQGKIQQARVFLSRAKQVMPKHRQLTKMQRLINGHVVKQVVVVPGPETAVPMMRKQQLPLPIKLIDQQDEQFAQWLSIVALKTHSLSATMLIVAPTDAQARWVYQTLNSANPDQRIRANIKRSRPARIEVSYLARKDELEVYAN